MAWRDLRVAGPSGLATWLVAPEDVSEGRLARLLGVLWLTGGLWVALALLAGVFADGWQPGVVVVVVSALVTGVGLLVAGQRELGVTVDLLLTVAGSVAIGLVVLWGGAGGAVTGVLYVYVACFVFIALRPYAVPLMVLASGLHLGALVASGRANLVGIWILTWGSAGLTGLLTGAAVDHLRDHVARLRQVEEHRTRFIAAVSHELRTPLTAILGFAETLQRTGPTLGDDERARYVAIIERQARRQLRLVEDVLRLTAAEAGASPPEPAEVVLAVAAEHALESAQVAARLAVDPDLRVSVDSDHLQQILVNLLVNADRYGEPPIELRGRGGEGCVLVEVVDHGCGIDGGLDGSRLLEPFVQGDSGDRRVSSGVGLGLTICRDLVRANGGRMTYADTPGGGSTIRVELPRA